MKPQAIYELAAVMFIVSSAFALYQWYNKSYSVSKAVLLANQDTLKADDSATIFPASSPTDPLFSNFGRRIDLSAPLDLADQPMSYGQAIPI